MTTPLFRPLALLVPCLAWLALAGGCAGSQASHTLDIANPPPALDSTLGPDDVFQVRVFAEPDLSGAYRIGPDGTIDFPLIGRLTVAGKLPEGIADLLTARLRKYLQHPQISIFVKELNSKRITVYGQVQKPGTFPYMNVMTISQAISLAGGFSAMAARDRVLVSSFDHNRQQVTRIDLQDIVNGRAPNRFVQPGDEVYVPQRLF